MGATARVTSTGRNGRCPPCVAGARPRQAGVTIVELLLVIVIVAVLGALAGPRFFDNRGFDERAFAEELASAIRYAQKIAVGSGCRVRVTLTATSYSLAQQLPQASHCDPADASFPVAVLLPSGQPAAATAPAGVSIAPAGSVVFDALGRTDLGADAAISIGPHTLDLQADSGLLRGPL